MKRQLINVTCGQRIDKTRVKHFINLMLKNTEGSCNRIFDKFEIIDVDVSAFGLRIKISFHLLFYS
jgi:hypothetical protein